MSRISVERRGGGNRSDPQQVQVPTEPVRHLAQQSHQLPTQVPQVFLLQAHQQRKGKPHNSLHPENSHVDLSIVFSRGPVSRYLVLRALLKHFGFTFYLCRPCQYTFITNLFHFCNTVDFLLPVYFIFCYIRTLLRGRWILEGNDIALSNNVHPLTHLFYEYICMVPFLKGQCHEMNHFYKGLKNLISTFCIGADRILNFFDIFNVSKRTF